MQFKDTILNPIAQRLLLSGCAYNFRRRAWRCPACRRPSVLRLLSQLDGSIDLSCSSGCAPRCVLGILEASYFDVGPACFRTKDAS